MEFIANNSEFAMHMLFTPYVSKASKSSYTILSLVVKDIPKRTTMTNSKASKYNMNNVYTIDYLTY